MIDIDEAGVTVAIADMQVVHIELQRVRIEMNCAQRDRAIEHDTQTALQLALDDGRRDKEAEQAEHDQHDGNDQRGFACAPRVIQPFGAVARHSQTGSCWARIVHDHGIPLRVDRESLREREVRGRNPLSLGRPLSVRHVTWRENPDQTREIAPIDGFNSRE